MAKRSRLALGAVFACCAISGATAGPAFSILYHEAIRPESQRISGHTRALSFEAYGRHFSVHLQPNAAVSRAVPAGRADIEPLSGQLEGLPGSWVRLTHTRTGWHGLVSDGQELYAIEPAADVAGALVQPLRPGPGTAVMYRLKDALVPAGPGFCEVLNADGTAYVGGDSVPPPDSQGRVTAKAVFDSIVRDAGASTGPHLQMSLGVVADYQFYQNFSSDPEGEIVSRINVVDGIWSSQVGIKIALGPLTVLKTADEPFTVTDPTALLGQVRQYRGSHSEQMATGVTHLITGRDLDGDIVGISYMNSVCNGDTADSLSEGSHAALMSELIIAHELGHNFNAPHDGEAGACSTTPQTFLMAPKINFSSQFSSCSLQQIGARMKSAQCLTPYQAPDVAVELPATLVGAVANTPFTLSFTAQAVGDDPSTDVSAIANLPSSLTLQSATAAGGTCTVDGSSATCSLGKLMPQESRQIDLTVVGVNPGTSTAAVSVTSSNDSVVDNNSAQISIEVSTGPPATAPVTSGSGGPDSGGGGGGGGSLDWRVLGLLAGAAGFAVRRRIHSFSGTLRIEPPACNP